MIAHIKTIIAYSALCAALAACEHTPENIDRANRLGAMGATMSGTGAAIYGASTPQAPAPATMMTCTRTGPYLNCF
jgi:hypothetical protein